MKFKLLIVHVFSLALLGISLTGCRVNPVQPVLPPAVVVPTPPLQVTPTPVPVDQKTELERVFDALQPLHRRHLQNEQVTYGEVQEALRSIGARPYITRSRNAAGVVDGGGRVVYAVAYKGESRDAAISYDAQGVIYEFQLGL